MIVNKQMIRSMYTILYSVKTRHKQCSTGIVQTILKVEAFV